MRYWCDAFRMPSWSEEEITHRHRAVNAHRLEDAELRVVPNVGHLVHYEAVEYAAEELIAFLHGESRNEGERSA